MQRGEQQRESERGRVQSAPNGCLITAQYLGQRCCWLCGPAGAHQEVEGAPTPQEEYGALGLAPTPPDHLPPGPRP